MNLSIIEYLVYAFPAYTSLLMLIISTIKVVPEYETSSLARTLFFMPGIVCVAILVTSGPYIMLDTIHTVNLTNDTNGQIFTETTDTTDQITLLSPVWSMVHFIIFITLIIYVFKQFLLMLGVGKVKNNPQL